MSLVSIVTYNNAGTIIRTVLKKVLIELEDEEGNPIQRIQLICQDQQTSPSGFWKRPFTMTAENDFRVPLVDSGGQPVWEDASLPEDERFQATIGEFDMWKILVFDNHLISLNDAFSAAIYRRKNLVSEPYTFTLPA